MKIEQLLTEPSPRTDETQFRSKIEAAKRLLSAEVERYDERWIVGHKGDQTKNLVDLGIMGPEIEVAHVHSSLGIRARRVISPPPGSAESYEGLLTQASPELEEEVKRAASQNRRVLIFMPFPNAQFESMVGRSGQPENFTMTAPLANSRAFVQIESKLNYTRLLEEELTAAGLAANIIPWGIYEKGMTLEQIKSSVNAKNGRPVYFQIDLSGGGDGTVRINSQAELDALLSNPHWAHQLDRGLVKFAREVENAYPTNGTGCIIPNPDGSDCIVLLDPPSHKPVGLKKLNAKQGSGVGNDWGVPFSSKEIAQYTKVATAIGKRYYKDFGYTGIFGPDGMFAQGNYHTTETNARWQGTTPYQTLNAIMNHRLPLELIHYLVKTAGRDSEKLAALHELVGDPNHYNQQIITESGGFYIKVGGPKERKMVGTDLNGPWAWDHNTLTRISHNGDVTPRDIYTRSYRGSRIASSNGTTPIYIKAPGVGEVVGGELAPIGYIVGSGLQVFDSERPDVTEAGWNLYMATLALMFSQQND